MGLLIAYGGCRRRNGAFAALSTVCLSPSTRRRGKPRAMTNTIAIWIAALIIATFALDALVFEWGLPVLLMRELSYLIEWLAVWR